MALTDIDFQEGEGQDFIVELPVGTLNAPVDILIETESAGYPVLEAPEIVDQGGGGNVFIIND